MRSFLLIVITIIVNFTYSQAQKDPELKNALSKMTAASIASYRESYLTTANKTDGWE